MNEAEKIAIEAIAGRSDVGPKARELLLRLIGGPAPDASGETLRNRKARNQREARARHRTNGDASPHVTSVTGDVTGHVTGDRPSRALSRSRSFLSNSDLVEGSREERARNVTGDVTGHVTAHVTGDIVSLRDPLPEELRDAALMNTGVKDVDAAWQKFTGHHNGRPYSTLPGGISGAWQRWAAQEAQYERRDRERPSSVRSKSLTQPGTMADIQGGMFLPNPGQKAG